jgi:outer membrane immunogenic protein
VSVEEDLMLRFVFGSLVLAATIINSPASATDWTGPYLGVSVGEGENDHGVTLSGDPVTQAVIGLGVLPSSIAVHASGIVGGAEAGYDYQWGRIVVGAVTDFSGTDISKSQSVSSAVPGGFFPFTTTAKQSISWFGTARLRAGATLTDDLLVYATGGVAYANVKTSESVTSTTTPICIGICTSSSLSATKVGRTFGGGIQFAVTDHLSIKGEWLNYDLGSTKLNGTDIFGRFPSIITFTTHYSGNVYRIGGNFKF